MIYLNYNNLDGETQEQLLRQSKEEIEERHGNELKTYAIIHHLDYEGILEEEAIRNLYTYQYVFNI